PPDSQYTDFNWEIYPDGLRECLERVQNEYNPKALYITENGACYDDDINAEGVVADHKRQKYLEQHLEAAHQARSNGAKLEGYFAWSLMDNFEWAEGYSRRFGLVHVDFETQKRTPKLSEHWYKNFLGNP
ncbi:MAG: hypothetical protein RLZZ156_1269, partial [Deinococcota bacterium]